MADDKESGVVFSFRARQFALLLALNFLLFVIVFAVGVRVGKNMARRSKVAGSFPGPVVTREIASPTKESAERAASALAQKAEEMAGVREMPLPSQAASKPPAVVKALPEREAAPAVEKKAVPAPSFTVQISAHREESLARKAAKRLRGKGLDAFVNRVQVKGKGRWFRVQVGRFGDRDAAQRMADRLSRILGRKVIVSSL